LVPAAPAAAASATTASTAASATVGTQTSLATSAAAQRGRAVAVSAGNSERSPHPTEAALQTNVALEPAAAPALTRLGVALGAGARLPGAAQQVSATLAVYTARSLTFTLAPTGSRTPAFGAVALTSSAAFGAGFGTITLPSLQCASASRRRATMRVLPTSRGTTQ